MAKTQNTAQMEWFAKILKNHPSTDGWKVFVFTHAPPNGSGLRVLQENHVVNGCCWLNHSDEKKCSKFIELVREHRCIKAWFSGHFHLGQDYQDSITFPTIDPKDGPYPNRGSCVFVQTVRRVTTTPALPALATHTCLLAPFAVCARTHVKWHAAPHMRTIRKQNVF